MLWFCLILRRFDDMICGSLIPYRRNQSGIYWRGFCDVLSFSSAWNLMSLGQWFVWWVLKNVSSQICSLIFVMSIIWRQTSSHATHQARLPHFNQLKYNPCSSISYDLPCNKIAQGLHNFSFPHQPLTKIFS